MPRRFPIVQRPNRSLTIAMLAGVLARTSSGPTRRRARLVCDMATMAWSGQEVLRGANWFRRALGLAAGARAVRSLAGNGRA